MNKIFVFIMLLIISSNNSDYLPEFTEHTVAADILGGYQVVVSDLNKDGKPDLIALGTNMQDLVWFENPAWKRHIIAGGFTKLINLAVLNYKSHPVIVLASNFSSEAKNSLGIISVLEPGSDVTKLWNIREIDRIPTAHRVRLADIDGSGNKVVIVAPLTAADASSPEYKGHVPLVYYKPGEWKRRLIGDQNEGVMHGIYVIDWDGDGRDEILAASFIGIHLYKLLPDGSWSWTEIVKGDPSPWPKSGASDLALGQVGKSRFICSIEPWHGNQVVVYKKQDNKWARKVIDDSFKEGHTIFTADLNNDGNDEIIAGYRLEGGSAFIYTAEDGHGLRWKRNILDNKISAAACEVADLNNDGKLDITVIGSATNDLKWYENK
jgi:Aldos-2-ulose dehydratase, beta-propeller domain/FG-GAP-like repeat